MNILINSFLKVSVGECCIQRNGEINFTNNRNGSRHKAEI